MIKLIEHYRRNEHYTSSELEYVSYPLIAMVKFNERYLSNSLDYVYKPQIAQRMKLTALTESTEMSKANPNLDGTGTLYTVLTSTATNGTYIKTITIKTNLKTTRGMVRLYVFDGVNTDIIAEIEIPAVIPLSKREAFAISIDVDFMLEDDWILKASMENGSENTIVTAEGFDIGFP